MVQNFFGKRSGDWPALLLITAATIIVTWPIVGELGAGIPGSEGDAWEHFWIFQWVESALFNGTDLFYTDLIFHPGGTSLATHNFAWVNIGLWLPLQAVVGAGAAYSLVMLAAFVLNGFAVYLFVRAVTGRFSAAIAAAMVAAFWPHILSHHDHPNLIVTAWVTLTLFSLHRLFQTGKQRYAILSGVFLALVGLTRWQTLVLGGVAIGLFLLYQYWLNRSSIDGRAFARSMGLMAGTAVLLMLPLFLAQFSGVTGLGETIAGVSDGNAGQSDLLAYLLPNRFHPWWGQAAFERFYGPLQTNKVFTPFLGYTTLALVIIGVVGQWRRTRFWLGLGLLYGLLALGPVLLINGRSYIPLPYQLLEPTFIGALVRSPDRFNVFLSLPVAVMVGLGVVAVVESSRLKRPMRLGLAALAVLLILVEYAVHYPTLTLDDFPAWYYALAEEPDDFAILELPMSDRIYDEVYMHYQALHGKPIVGGSVARPPAGTFDFINALPMLEGVPDEQAPPEGVVHVGSHLTTLAEAGVKYVVFHKKFIRERQLQQWRDWLFIPSYHEDEEVLVYQTDWVVGQSLPFTPLMDNGLGIISADVQPASTTQDGWVEVAVQWGTRAALSEVYEVCFRLENTAGVAVSDTCFPISTERPTDLWPRNEMVAATYLLHMSPYLASDTYTILAGIGGTGEGEVVAVGSVDFSARPRVFTEATASDALVNWENEIALLDYQVHQTAVHTLDVELEWLALERMDKSYKVFVHVIDSETRELVSQVDTVPLDWGYPTHWWEAGELVSDTLELLVPAGSEGDYDVWLGIYSLDPDDPLPAVESSVDSLPVEENRIQLARFVIDGDGVVE